MPKRLKAESISQSTLFEWQTKPVQAVQQKPERHEIPGILLGTSSFTAKGWEGVFYPAGMRSQDFLSYYAEQFRTVEIDSTFYGTPKPSTVKNWKERTSSDFVFAVKVPQIVTHGKFWLVANRSLMSSLK